MPSQLRGKQRLLLAAAVVAAVVVVFVLISSRQTSKAQPGTTARATASVAANVPVVVVTASPNQVNQLGAWLLKPGDIPAGANLLHSTELTDFVAASGQAAAVRQIAATGRVTGWVQQWCNSTDQFEVSAESDLFQQATQATARLGQAVQASGTTQVLTPPRLGDASRMYSFTTVPPANQPLTCLTSLPGKEVQGYTVAWVRDRVLFVVTADGAAGVVKSDMVVNAAKAIDGRAAKQPLPIPENP